MISTISSRGSNSEPTFILAIEELVGKFIKLFNGVGVWQLRLDSFQEPIASLDKSSSVNWLVEHIPVVQVCFLALGKDTVIVVWVDGKERELALAETADVLPNLPGRVGHSVSVRNQSSLTDTGKSNVVHQRAKTLLCCDSVHYPCTITLCSMGNVNYSHNQLAGV